MKKLTLLLCLMCIISIGHTSKLSKFFKDLDKEDRARQEHEWQKDMNFGDFSFRLDKRYIDERSQHCRDYKFRARSNPYRHGYYTVCEEHLR